MNWTSMIAHFSLSFYYNNIIFSIHKNILYKVYERNIIFLYITTSYVEIFEYQYFDRKYH